ncbi:MAG TPA: carboxypeptidase regulatory-like domain-containing protein [Bacteroidota bacterium]|nr:carboxypeptidase regulatory-like domain-containing protein [Bacteroidota bacterium]
MFKQLRAVYSVLLLSAVFTSLSFAGTITGKVSFKGAKPAITMIKMNADTKCVSMHHGKDVPSEMVIVNSNNTLKDVFIHITKGLEGKKFPTPTAKVTLTQEGCMYHPHVFGMMANQPLEIVNADPTLHNIHALPKNSKQFNIAQPIQNSRRTETFDKPEVMVKLKCDVHSWMAAYVGVLDNPFYAVTDDKGDFTIKNLPAGTYTVEAWHEKYGTQTMNITVGASDTKTADFTMGGQ